MKRLNLSKEDIDSLCSQAETFINNGEEDITIETLELSEEEMIGSKILMELYNKLLNDMLCMSGIPLEYLNIGSDK